MNRPDVIIERCSNYYEMNSSYSWSGEIAVLLDYIKELEGKTEKLEHYFSAALCYLDDETREEITDNFYANEEESSENEENK